MTHPVNPKSVAVAQGDGKTTEARQVLSIWSVIHEARRQRKILSVSPGTAANALAVK